LAWPAALKCVATWTGSWSQTCRYWSATSGSASQRKTVASWKIRRCIDCPWLLVPGFEQPNTRCLLLTTDFLPALDVGDAFLVAIHHNFRTFFDGASVFAARAAGAACAGLRVNDFAGAVFTYGHRDSSQHADHFVVGGVHVLLVRNQHACEEQKNDGGAEESRSQGNQQAEREPYAGEARDQKSCPAEPRQKRRQGDEVERRHRRLASRMRSRAARVPMHHWRVSGGNMPAAM